MKTNANIIVNFRNYGEIKIPKGVRTTNITACGVDKKYNFIDEFGWIKTEHPEISKTLEHDARYYGINIPVQYLED